jgi:hypothetical protein
MRALKLGEGRIKVRFRLLRGCEMALMRFEETYESRSTKIQRERLCERSCSAARRIGGGEEKEEVARLASVFKREMYACRGDTIVGSSGGSIEACERYFERTRLWWLMEKRW